MDAAMETCLNTFKLGSAMFLEGVATMDAETARKRIAGDVNPPLWLAGHLLDHRKYLLDLFGKEQEMPFGLTFREPYDPAKEYPSMEQIKEKWVAISDQLFEKMAAASDDDFATPVDWNLPNGDKTVRGAVLFYIYHEGYHLGQISYTRRGLGMKGLVPF